MSKDEKILSLVAIVVLTSLVMLALFFNLIDDNRIDRLENEKSRITV